MGKPGGELDELDLELLRKLASGEGGRRTGALKRAGYLEWTVTGAGRAALEADKSFEPSLTATEHRRRLASMSVDIGQTWNLSDNDRAALRWALDMVKLTESAMVQVNQLREQVHDLALCADNGHVDEGGKTECSRCGARL